MKRLMVIGMAACAFGVQAVSIMYTAKGTNPLDLSEAANWASSPTSADRGIIDFKAITTTSNFVLSADLELTDLILSNNTKGVVSLESANGSTLTLASGAHIWNTGTSPFVLKSGTVTSAGAVGVAQGFVEIAGGAVIAPAELTTPTDSLAGQSAIGLALSSGTVTAKTIRTGVRSGKDNTVSPDIRQTGGTAVASGALEIGQGRVGGKSSDASNPGDYILEGGSLTAPKLILAGRDGICNNERYGRYVQKDGTATLGGIYFGSSTAFDAFGQFDLTGGTLNLGAIGPIEGSVFGSELGYQFRQAGGTVKAANDLDVNFAYDIEKGTAPSIWDTAGHAVTFKGPIRGKGDFVKKGEGTLTITDASAFSGRMTVEQGTVQVVGAASEPVYTGYAKYLRFTADDIEDTCCEGDKLTNWVSTTGTGAATYTGWAQTNSKPTVVTEDGRKWVYFNQSALEIPTAQNPVAGQTNFLVALVFKTSQSGSGSGSGWWNMHGVLGNEQSSYPADWGVAFTQMGKFCGGGGSIHKYQSGDSDSAHMWLETANTTSLADGKTHVFIWGYSGATMEMVVDGTYAGKTLTENLCNPIPGRQMLPCYVGAHNPAATKFKSMSWQKGYMAELRIYGGKTFSRSEMEALGRYLGAYYQAPAQNWDLTYAQNAVVKAAFDAAEETPALPTHSADWCADTLAGTVADGAQVADWPSVDGTRHATTTAATCLYWRGDHETEAGAGTIAPTFVSRNANGHAAVHFNSIKSSARTMLAVPAEDSPISGAMNYTVAAVISTDVEPANASSWANQGQWMTTFLSTANGLWKGYYDCCNTNSFFAGLTRGGGVHFVTAKKAIQSYDYVYPSGPMRLHDGKPHCIVFAHDRKTGTRRVMIDGYVQTAVGGVTFSDNETMLAQRVLVGVVDAGSKFWAADFHGDISAFRLYGEALDEEEMRTLTEGWCAKYGITPIDGGLYVQNDPPQNGLGVTNITVAAGATLALPCAETPFTVTKDMAFTCAGTVTGSLAFGAGSELDVTAASSVDDLRLSDATLRLPLGTKGGTAPLHVKKVTLSGTVTFASTVNQRKRGRYPLLTADEPIVLDGVTTQLAGTAGILQLSNDGKTLNVYIAGGLTIILK